MKRFFHKPQPKNIQKTEKFLEKMKLQPNKEFEQTLETKILHKMNTVSDIDVPKKSSFAFKKLFWLASPLIVLIAFTIVKPDFVSAQLGQIKKLIFGEYAFDFGEKDKIAGTYITLSAVLEDKSIDQQIQNILQENKKSLENFIHLKDDEPAEILLRDELLTGELYIILLGKDQQPLRGGIIQKNTDGYSSDIEKDPDFAMDTLCETLEYNQNPLTTTDNTYEYNNPNWGMKYTVPKTNSLEPGEICGGGGGFVGSGLQVTTQFSPSFSEEEKQSFDFLTISVAFPVTENNPLPTSDTKKFMIGSDEGSIQEKIHKKNPSIDNDSEQSIEKEFTLRKNGFLYTVNYQSSLAQKDTYDTLFYAVLHSLKLSDPLWLSPNRDDTAFLKVFETGEIYDLKNNEWIKKSKPKYLDQEHDDEESSERVEAPLSTEEKIDIPLSIISPLSVFKVSQNFHSNHHNGVDFVTSNDTNKKADNSPVFAVADGTVTHAECGWNGGYGCYIQIHHGHDIETLYAHTQKNFVSVGQTVKQGDIIGVIGDTGRATGPHLHFEIRVNHIAVDPVHYLK